MTMIMVIHNRPETRHKEINKYLTDTKHRHEEVVEGWIRWAVRDNSISFGLIIQILTAEEIRCVFDDI